MVRKVTSITMALGFALISMAALAPNVVAASQDLAFSSFSAAAGGTQYATHATPAAVTVNFGTTGTWTVSGGNDCSTGLLGATWEMGYADDAAGLNWVTISAAPATIDFNAGGCTFNAITPAAVAVPVGKYLSIKITDVSDIPVDTATADANGFNVATPTDDPGFPTPSIATIVLLSMGLLMVAGVVYARKQR